MSYNFYVCLFIIDRTQTSKVRLIKIQDTGFAKNKPKSINMRIQILEIRVGWSVLEL